MIPIVIAVLQKVQTPGISVIGMTMLLQFVVSFGFVLPVNSPQGMVAYGIGDVLGTRLHPHRAGADRAGLSADPAVRRDLLALAGLRVARHLSPQPVPARVHLRSSHHLLLEQRGRSPRRRVPVLASTSRVCSPSAAHARAWSRSRTAAGRECSASAPAPARPAASSHDMIPVAATCSSCRNS